MLPALVVLCISSYIFYCFICSSVPLSLIPLFYFSPQLIFWRSCGKIVFWFSAHYLVLKGLQMIRGCRDLLSCPESPFLLLYKSKIGELKMLFLSLSTYIFLSGSGWSRWTLWVRVPSVSLLVWCRPCSPVQMWPRQTSKCFLLVKPAWGFAGRWGTDTHTQSTPNKGVLHVNIFKILNLYL